MQALRRQRRGRRGADGRGGRCDRRGLAVRVAPAHRRRAADLHPLLEQCRRGDGAARQRRSRASPTSRARSSAIAGGPLDKGWLLLQAYATQTPRHRPRRDAEPVFGAPPLLTEKLEERRARRRAQLLAFRRPAGGRRATGRWSASARSQELGRAGQRAAAGLRLRGALRQRPAPEPGAGVRRASRDAKQLLMTSDAEWHALMPLTKAENDAELEAFMRRYREGIVEHWGEAAAGRGRQALRGPGRARRREAGGPGQGAGPRHLLAERELLRRAWRAPRSPAARAAGRGPAAGGGAARREACVACCVPACCLAAGRCWSCLAARGEPRRNARA